MRDTVQALPGSKIREVANAGLGRSDMLAFWFGESDEVTPQPVRDAAAASLQRGETFYSHNLGLPELRAAIAAYASGLHGPIDVDRIAVTSSGVSALMLAMQMLVEPGDEVVAVVPVWPNLTAQPLIMGASLRCVPLQARGGDWVLDLPALLAAVTPAIWQVLQESDCVLVDGTFWREDEMIEAGVSSKHASELGHLPQDGPEGMLAVLRTMRTASRRILIHINNRNPILDERSPERAELAAAGVEVAFDGMEIRL